MKKMIRKIILLGVATLLLVILAAGMISITTYSVDRDNEKKAMDSYYKALEKQYVAEVRERMNELGYNNAGVMLTRSVNVDGTRKYTLKLNHKKLTGISEEELLSELDVPEFFEGELICIMTSL